jgi:hypothetical protein
MACSQRHTSMHVICLKISNGKAWLAEQMCQRALYLENHVVHEKQQPTNKEVLEQTILLYHQLTCLFVCVVITCFPNSGTKTTLRLFFISTSSKSIFTTFW